MKPYPTLTLPLLAVSTVLLVGATPLAAAARSRPYVPSAGVSVRLVCDDGPCAELSRGGERWVVGDYGQRYSVVVSNPSGVWVEAVVTVDGRNILDGYRASARSRGYLVPPRDSITIDGWRTSTQDVAAFRFTTIGDSYAGRVGDTRDAGIIRVEVYPESTPRPVWIPERPVPYGDLDREGPRGVEKRGASEGAPAPRATADSFADRDWERGGQNLGTQFGESRYSPVTERDFRRASSRPSQVLTIRYDDRDGLRRRGLLPWPPRRPPVYPYRGDDRWVPAPPPGW